MQKKSQKALLSLCTTITASPYSRRRFLVWLPLPFRQPGDGSAQRSLRYVSWQQSFSFVYVQVNSSPYWQKRARKTVLIISTTGLAHSSRLFWVKAVCYAIPSLVLHTSLPSGASLSSKSVWLTCF